MSSEIDAEGRYTPAAAVIQELRQFERLRQLSPPISAADMAERMAWPVKDVLWLLKKLKDKRGDERPLDDQVFALLKQNNTYTEIAKKLHLTKGMVAGIVARARERESLGRG